MSKSIKRALLCALCLHLIAITAVFLFILAAHLTRNWGSMRVGECAARNMLHIYCPGCGGTRAVFALLSGHPILFFRYYPAALSIVGVVLFSDGCLFLSALKNDVSYLRFLKWWLILIPLISAVVVAIVRTLLAYYIKVDFLGDLTAISLSF